MLRPATVTAARRLRPKPVSVTVLARVTSTRRRAIIMLSDSDSDNIKFVAESARPRAIWNLDSCYIAYTGVI